MSRKRKATKKSSSDDGMPAWWESLKGEFECPVCLESMTDAPIFQCDNPLGHSICSKCHYTLKKDRKQCPVCKANLTNRRNLTSEKIVEKLPKVQCKYEGCDFKKSDGEALKKHEDNNCEYRHVPCARCDDKVPLKNIADHVINHNFTPGSNFTEFSTTQIRWVTTNAQNLQSVFRVDAKDHPTFLDNWQASEDDNAVYYWISFVGAKESAQKFMYTLKVGEANGAGRYPFEGTTFCVPCDLSHDNMKKYKCCLMLNRELLKEKSYVEENERRVDFTVSIHKA